MPSDPIRNALFTAELNAFIGAEAAFGQSRSAGDPVRPWPVLQGLARLVQAMAAPEAARPCRHALTQSR